MREGRRVALVGVGPGDPSYVTHKVAALVAEAEVVAGFATVLAVVDQWITGERLVLIYKNQEALLAELGRRHAAGRRCVVCAYGDLNFSARELIERVERHCGPTLRVPGISSVQVACARAGLAMEETLFLTLHVRGGIERAQAELVAAARANQRHLIALPLPWSFMPPEMAALLLDGGVPGARRVTVYQRLTLPGESATETTLTELAAWSGPAFSDLSIVVLPREEGEART